MIHHTHVTGQSRRTITNRPAVAKYAILRSEDIFGDLYVVSPERDIEDALAEGWEVVSQGLYWLQARRLRSELYGEVL